MMIPDNYADKEARLFVQRQPGSAWEFLRLAESVTAESIKMLDVTVKQITLKLDTLSRLHRRRMWPRWAALFTLIIAGVACVQG